MKRKADDRLTRIIVIRVTRAQAAMYGAAARRLGCTGCAFGRATMDAGARQFGWTLRGPSGQKGG